MRERVAGCGYVGVLDEPGHRHEGRWGERDLVGVVPGERVRRSDPAVVADLVAVDLDLRVAERLAEEEPGVEAPR